MLLLLNCYFYCPGVDTGPEPEEELLPFPLPDGPPDETFPEPAPVGVVELLPAFVVSALAIVIVSLATKAPSEEICKEFDSVGK